MGEVESLLGQLGHVTAGDITQEVGMETVSALSTQPHVLLEKSYVFNQNITAFFVPHTHKSARSCYLKRLIGQDGLLLTCLRFAARLACTELSRAIFYTVTPTLRKNFLRFLADKK